MNSLFPVCFSQFFFHPIFLHQSFQVDMLFSTMHTYFFTYFFPLSPPPAAKIRFNELRKHSPRIVHIETCQRNSISDTLENVKWHRHDRLQRHPAFFLNIRSDIPSVDSSWFFSQPKVKWDRAREFFCCLNTGQILNSITGLARRVRSSDFVIRNII